MIFEYDNIADFCENFDVVENALDQRSLLRWNGRAFKNRENLSEHTHLVIACSLKIYDTLSKNLRLAVKMNLAKIMKFALMHDSLELFRGDILSITKDSVPGLRKFIDDEEKLFIEKSLDFEIDDLTADVVKLADLMACYKYLERELEFPQSQYVANVYNVCRKRYFQECDKFCQKYQIAHRESDDVKLPQFRKGYANDAGTDIVLQEDVTIMPLSTLKVDLKVNVTPDENTMSYLCARTSAANKGLVVAMCPIDPNYTGEVSAIVHNVSNNIITFKKGESFCQLVTMPILDSNIDDVEIKKPGKRTDGKLGSTDI